MTIPMRAIQKLGVKAMRKSPPNMRTPLPRNLTQNGTTLTSVRVVLSPVWRVEVYAKVSVFFIHTLLSTESPIQNMKSIGSLLSSTSFYNKVSLSMILTSSEKTKCNIREHDQRN
jgi:hypothetical protein